MRKVLPILIIAGSLVGCGDDFTTVNLNNLSQKNIQQLQANGYKSKTNVYLLSQSDLQTLKKFDKAADAVDRYLIDINQSELTIDPELFGREFAGAYRFLEEEKNKYIGQVIRKQQIELGIHKSTRDVLLDSKQSMTPIVEDYARTLDPLKKKRNELKEQLVKKDAELERINAQAYELVTKFAKNKGIDVYIENKDTRFLAQGGFFKGNCKNKQYSELGYVFHSVNIDIKHFNCYYLRVPEQVSGVLSGERARKFLEDRVREYTSIHYELYGSSQTDMRKTGDIPITVMHNSYAAKYNEEMDRLERKYSYTRPDAEFELERLNREISSIDKELSGMAKLIEYSLKEGFKTADQTDIAKAYTDINKIFKAKYESVLQSKFSKSLTYPSSTFNIDNKTIPDGSVLFMERVIYSPEKTLRRDVWISTKEKLREIQGNLAASKPKMSTTGKGAENSIIRPFVDALN